MSKRIILVVLLMFMFFLGVIYAATFSDTTQDNFNGGTYNQTFYNATGGFVQLNASNTTGNYTSRIFNAGANSQWNNISWTEGTPYGKELPNNQQTESVLGGINMTGNVLLFHMNENTESYNKRLSEIDQALTTIETKSALKGKRGIFSLFKGKPKEEGSYETN